jgi:predicted transcriptional regulator
MAEDRELPALSEAQLEIMNLIWDHRECSVATVWHVLNERRGVSRNTVHTMIIRLEEKGWLNHREAHNGFLYSATVSREQAQRRCIQKLIDNVFDGSAESLVLALLKTKHLSKSEAERIRQMISKAQRRKS